MVIHESYDATRVKYGVDSIWNGAPARMTRVEDVADDRVLSMSLHRFSYSIFTNCFGEDW
uniref:Uncharacterized protein n=1 Tax=Arabidopsis thaliana TaxID=3702 RepID=Q56YL1_ARATH|nr:hypothetical protein [Arabidopsis thaliana]